MTSHVLLLKSKWFAPAFLAASAALSVFSTLANAGPWLPPKHGFVIQAGTPQGVPQQSGKKAQISGSISFVGGCRPGNRACRTLLELQRQLIEDDVVVVGCNESLSG
jgi:hypothetical protein